jgi:hypothetical protein
VQLVESLNDSPTWIDALEEMVVGKKSWVGCHKSIVLWQ